MKRFVLFAVCLSFVLGCGLIQKTDDLKTPPKTRRQLIKKIDAWFNDPKFENAFWGVVIESLDTGKVWYERNPNKLFVPASNQKIITTASALEELGPDFKFTTTLSYSGKITTPTLEGNLIVWSNGEPTMYDRLQKDSCEVFRYWAAVLKQHGITHIKGNIIGDDNAFDEERFGHGWSFYYLDIWYAAEISALQLNENTLDIKITPAIYDDIKPIIEPNLKSSYYQIINNLTTINTGKNSVIVSRDFDKNDIVVSGKVVAGGKPFTRTPSISNPTLFYVTVLKETLESEGIRVDGEPVDCDNISNWEELNKDLVLIDTHHSPPLSEIIKQLMKRSQNLYAETLVRVLGWKETGLGTFNDGRKVVQRRMSNFGISPDKYKYSDGSGLSRYNLISPRQITEILKGMKKSPNWQFWYDSMPIGGVDGTLEYRMRGTPAENNVHAKTGTVDNVRGLSGYVKTANGENIVFSFLVNAHLQETNDTNVITDNVLALIAGFKK